MQSCFGRVAVLLLGMTLCFSVHGQQARLSPPTVPATDPSLSAMPDAPEPQIDDTATQSQQSQAQQAPASQQPAPTSSSGGDGLKNGATQSSSSAPNQAQQPGTPESQHQKAEEELKEQEKQRVAGVMATFNTTRNRDAAPLSPGQKFHLFFKSAFDPWPFGLSAVVAGINQASNADPEWGQGVKGYAKRFGAGYSDYFIGNFFGNAALPSLLREDPRYFQKGSGSIASRFFWAAGSTVWCKRDRGSWGPNWANVGGNLIGAAIARSYYPAAERTVSDTVTDGLTVSAEGIVGAEVIEFWPDVVRHNRRKKAEKLARAEAAAEQKKQQDQKQDQK